MQAGKLAVDCQYKIINTCKNLAVDYYYKIINTRNLAVGYN